MREDLCKVQTVFKQNPVVDLMGGKRRLGLSWATRRIWFWPVGIGPVNLTS
jgi:hypothetical protein